MRRKLVLGALMVTLAVVFGASLTLFSGTTTSFAQGRTQYLIKCLDGSTTHSTQDVEQKVQRILGVC